MHSKEKFTKQMKKIIPLKKTKNYSTKKVGGKAKPIGELIEKNFNVPRGFVIPTDVFKEIEKENKIEKEISKILESINKNGMKNLEDGAAILKQIIKKIEIPKEIEKEIIEEANRLNVKNFAVRSSAVFEDSLNNSWAGEFETYLYVNVDQLINKIKKVWESLYSERALIYAFNQKIKFQRNMAILIQEMINSEFSGVCFTNAPSEINSNSLLIEAILGQGELLVSGNITPDKYWVNKSKLVIDDIEVSVQRMALVNKKLIKIGKRKLNQKIKGIEIIKLSKTFLKIEKIFNKPQDIEWAIFNNKIYILQSRPLKNV